MLRSREHKLYWWSSSPGGTSRAGRRVLAPYASMEFPGAPGPSAPLGLRSAKAWNRFWAIKGQMCARTLSIRVRLEKLRSEVLSVLTLGAAAWLMRPQVISAGSAAAGRRERWELSPTLVAMPRAGVTGGGGEWSPLVPGSPASQDAVAQAGAPETGCGGPRPAAPTGHRPSHCH